MKFEEFDTICIHLSSSVLEFRVQLEESFEQIAIVCTRQVGTWSEVVGGYEEHICFVHILCQMSRVQEAIV